MQKTYEGSCHCKAFTFAVDIDLKGVTVCNCSICSRAGYVMAFADPEHVRVKSGEDALKDYRFNKQVIGHLFCTTCGIHPIARGKKRDGSPMVMINVRCLEGVELDELPVSKFDGRSL